MINVIPGKTSDILNRIDETETGRISSDNLQATSANFQKLDTMFIVGGVDQAPYPYPTTAVSIDIVSTNANDTVAGSGGRLVAVIGLDGNRGRLTEIVSMNGLTPVTLQNTFLRINKLFLVGSDIRGINAGDISVTTTVGGDLLGKMLTGTGQSYDGIISTPVNFTTQIFIIDIAAGKGDSGSIAFFRSSDDGPFVQRTAPIFFYENNFERSFAGPIIIPENSDTELRAIVNNNNTRLTAVSQLISSVNGSQVSIIVVPKVGP